MKYVRLARYFKEIQNKILSDNFVESLSKENIKMNAALSLLKTNNIAFYSGSPKS